ncbi:MAG: hypothetical protein J0L92_28845 [Deltaproteobacteria bacterium]|nr:hypothetical protein [Deltaproteobacteria bacterium]
MWEYAVEVGVAAFVGLPGCPASAIEGRLVELGLAPALARHLVTWIPEAFAARVFTGFDFLDTYVIAEGEGSEHGLTVAAPKVRGQSMASRWQPDARARPSRCH